jgi:hypothetical protein
MMLVKKSQSAWQDLCEQGQNNLESASLKLFRCKFTHSFLKQDLFTSMTNKYCSNGQAYEKVRVNLRQKSFTSASIKSLPKHKRTSLFIRRVTVE